MKSPQSTKWGTEGTILFHSQSAKMTGITWSRIPKDSPRGGAVSKNRQMRRNSRHGDEVRSSDNSERPTELGAASFTASALREPSARTKMMTRKSNRFAQYLKPALWSMAFLAVTCVAARNNGTFASLLSPAPHRASSSPLRNGPAPVNLGTAGSFVILAKSGITNVPTSAITGNLGVSPIASTAITGFGLTYPAGSAFSTSAQVTGKIYAATYASPTPSNLTVAIGDMHTAYHDAAGRKSPDHTELAVGNIGGLTLSPGLYKWSTSVSLGKDVTLTGGPNDVWIFQIAGDVTEASATKVILTGGAQAKNIFWQVAGVMALGTTAHMEGVVLSKTAVTLNTGASVNGRLMAQTNVTLIMNTIVEPAP